VKLPSGGCPKMTCGRKKSCDNQSLQFYFWSTCWDSPSGDLDTINLHTLHNSAQKNIKSPPNQEFNFLLSFCANHRIERTH
jgi:hypothetical protein